MARSNWDDWRQELEAIPQRFRSFYNELEGSFKKNFPVEMFGGGPRIELSEDSGNYFVEFDLPGIKKEDLKLTIADNTLLLKGKRNRTETTSGRKMIHSERLAGDFERKVPLRDNINEGAIRASFVDSVLSLVIPKDPVDPPKEREIPIG